MSSGEQDLGRILQGLAPRLSQERYTFERCDHPAWEADMFALVREDEATSVVRATANGKWARISLGIHSSLEAVGLTAIVSGRLAEAAISANIIAGLYHDHIFVPWDRRHDAVAAMQTLSEPRLD